MRMTLTGVWKLSAEPAEITVNAADEAQARAYAEASGIIVTAVRPASACVHGADAARRPHPLPSPVGASAPNNGVR